MVAIIISMIFHTNRKTSVSMIDRGGEGGGGEEMT